MRIVAGGFQRDDVFGFVGFAVVVGIAHAEDAASFGEVHPVVFAHANVHAHFEALVKNTALGFAFGRGSKHQHAITLGAFVIFRPKMGVAFDDDDAALGVHTEAGGGDDVGRLGDELDDDARVGRLGRLGCIVSSKQGEGKGGQKY